MLSLIPFLFSFLKGVCFFRLIDSTPKSSVSLGSIKTVTKFKERKSSPYTGKSRRSTVILLNTLPPPLSRKSSSD